MLNISIVNQRIMYIMNFKLHFPVVMSDSSSLQSKSSMKKISCDTGLDCFEHYQICVQGQCTTLEESTGIESWVIGTIIIGTVLLVMSRDAQKSFIVESRIFHPHSTIFDYFSTFAHSAYCALCSNYFAIV